MDINVQKVYAMPIKLIRLGSLTSLSRVVPTGIIYIYIYISLIYIYISYVHEYLQYDITYLIPIYLYINNSNAWPTTPYIVTVGKSHHPIPQIPSDHAEE